MVDYTEWLAMRDWHSLRSHIFEANSDLNYGAVQNDYESNIAFNRAKQGVANWIQNIHFYGPHGRAGCSPAFTIRPNKGGGNKVLTYNVPPNMNKQ